MNDPVNNPSHYNQNGIEVIDVIETYAKDDFRLANVIKYVCRAGYKGNKLQDLKKAEWYLKRAINDRVDVVVEEAPFGPSYTEREEEVFFQGYDCRIQDEAAAEEREVEQALKDESWMLDAFTAEELDEIVSLKNEIGRYATMGAGPIPEKVYEIPYSPQEAHLPPDRIAGDDEAATRIKDAYYGFGRFEIRGYCASCDAEISATQPFIKSLEFDPDLMFCKQQCVDSLKAWQRDWPL